MKKFKSIVGGLAGVAAALAIGTAVPAHATGFDPDSYAYDGGCKSDNR
jgi:hypothetical protein